MAITKILYRNGGLRQAIDYITNPVKTDENLLTDYIRCDPGHAAQQMMDTKRTLGKTAGRQCYHIIQSFKPDEITPELAHEIAKQFAAEHLPGYEAVIATHVDKAHIHSHIVFNSVNAVTGKMYHSTCENYSKQIRGVSDRLCKAHGLSIVLENDEKKVILSNSATDTTGSSVRFEGNLGQISGDGALIEAMIKDTSDWENNLYLELTTTDKSGTDNVYQLQMLLTEVTDIES